MVDRLPPLPYSDGALEPAINAVTLRWHHDLHHGANVADLNEALRDHPALVMRTPVELVSDLTSVSAVTSRAG